MAIDDGLRDRIAKAALDAAAYDSLDDPWCTNEDYCEGPVEWDIATDRWRHNGYRIADAVLAVLPSAPRVDVDAVMDAVDRYVESRLECWPNSDECCAAILAMLEGTA